MTSSDQIPVNPEWARQLDRYVVYLVAERNASPYTIRNYRAEIEQFLRHLDGEGIHDWSAVDRMVLRAYLGWLADAGYERASIARRVSEVRSFCRFLVANGDLDHNPLAAVQSIKLAKRLPHYLSQQDVEAILAQPQERHPAGAARPGHPGDALRVGRARQRAGEAEPGRRRPAPG